MSLSARRQRAGRGDRAQQGREAACRSSPASTRPTRASSRCCRKASAGCPQQAGSTPADRQEENLFCSGTSALRRSARRRPDVSKLSDLRDRARDQVKHALGRPPAREHLDPGSWPSRRSCSTEPSCRRSTRASARAPVGVHPPGSPAEGTTVICAAPTFRERTATRTG